MGAENRISPKKKKRKERKRKKTDECSMRHHHLCFFSNIIISINFCFILPYSLSCLVCTHGSVLSVQSFKNLSLFTTVF